MGKKIKLMLATMVIAGFFMSPAFAAYTDSFKVWSVADGGNGYTYYLIGGGTNSNPSGISWQDAENYAINTLNGHLATVDSATTQSWLWSNFGAGANKNLWIGLTDNEAYGAQEGQFEWVATGNAPTYTNWYSPTRYSEPNNGGGNEDFAHMLYSSFDIPSDRNPDGTHYVSNGKWNDMTGSATSWSITTGTSGQFYAIAEVAPVVTPEPVSSVLFLLGGGAMAFGRFRRNI